MSVSVWKYISTSEMENNLIDSLLYHETAPLSHPLAEKFNEHIELTYLSPTYVIHFLMGISVMLMSDDIRRKHGVQRVFFTSFQDEKIARLVILTDRGPVGGKYAGKSMKVRSFDIGAKRTGNKLVLTSEEYKIMKLLSAGDVGDLPKDIVTKVEALYNNDEQGLEKINLDEYPIDYALYEITREEMYKLSQLDTKTRVRVNFVEDFNDAKLKKQLEKIDQLAPKLFSPGKEAEFSNLENKITLFTDRKIITTTSSENFDPNALPIFYKEYFDARGEAGLEKFASFFTGKNGLGEVYKQISYMGGIAAECGFTHGSLFILSYSYPSYIEVRQEIATALYTPGEDHTQEPASVMSLIHRPKYTGTEHSLNQMPIVVFFPKHHAIVSKAANEVPLAMSITGQTGVISVKLRMNKIMSRQMIKLGKRPDFIDVLSEWIQDPSITPEVLADLVKSDLNKVRSPLRKYKFTDRNYFSRYLAGWIASSENEESISHVLLRKTGDSGSTKFLIKSTKKVEEEPNKSDEESASDTEMLDEDDHIETMDVEQKSGQSPPSYVMLVVTEEPVSKMHYSDALDHEEPYVRYQRMQKDDTLILNIRQEYVHSKTDILDTNVQEDFTRFVVSVSFAKSEDVMNAHELFPLPRIPLSTLVTTNRKPQIAPLLQLGTYFASDHSAYEAFLDGIFLNNECLKSGVNEKSTHADIHYLRRSGRQGKITKINFKKIFNDLTKEKLIQIAKVASEEFNSQKTDGPLFQIISYRKAFELLVKVLNKEQLLSCAGTRLRRSELLKCDIDFESLDSNADRNSIDKIISPKAFKYLTRILKISNYMILGFMVRDAISDAYNKQYWNLATDVGILLASAFSPTLGKIASAMGNELTRTGSRFSGFALRSLGFGIKRAIFLYVLTDLVENAFTYARDVNNTDARLGMAIDGAFVTVDLLTIAATAMGASAVFGFVGEIAIAAFIVGQNIYQTVKRVQQLENIIPLNYGEIVDESLRAFFHIDTEKYVQELLNEKQLNSKLAQEAVKYLNSQDSIDSYITASAKSNGQTLSIHGDTWIDMRLSFRQRVSRTSPGIDVSENLRMACFVHEEQIELEHKPNFWERVVGFFWKVSKAVRLLNLIAYGNYTAALSVAYECGDCIERNTPICHNAFGVLKPGAQDKAAFFNLGTRSDHVFGYTQKSNIFLMTGGMKNVTGGDKTDTFILSSGTVTGVLDGQAGADILDLSSFSPDELEVQEGFLKYVMGSVNTSLQIENIETIILPVGNSNKSYVQVIIKRNLRRIVSQGRTNFYIQANNLDENDLVLQISGNTNVINYATNGQITYIIGRNKNNETEDTSLSIFRESDTRHVIHFMENLWDLESNVYHDGEIAFRMTDGQKIRFLISLKNFDNVEFVFKDGSVVRSNSSAIFYATLTTSLTIIEIRNRYTDLLQKLGMIMLAYSNVDAEFITLNGKLEQSKSTQLNQILHNSIDKSTDLMLKDGRYLIIIHPNREGKIETTTIRSKNATTLEEVIIDLSDVIHFYIRDNTSFLQVFALLTNQLTLVIGIRLKKQNYSIAIGNVLIKHALRNDFYEKIIVRNYGELKINLQDRISNYYKVKDEEDYARGITIFEKENIFIQPKPIIFSNSTDIVVLTPYNVEPFNEIVIDVEAYNFEVFSIGNTTLFLTNFRYRNFENMISIFIESFYSVEKMRTLRLYVARERINLEERKLQASDLTNFWADFQRTGSGGIFDG